MEARRWTGTVDERTSRIQLEKKRGETLQASWKSEGIWRSKTAQYDLEDNLRCAVEHRKNRWRYVSSLARPRLCASNSVLTTGKAIWCSKVKTIERRWPFENAKGHRKTSLTNVKSTKNCCDYYWISLKAKLTPRKLATPWCKSNWSGSGIKPFLRNLPRNAVTCAKRTIAARWVLQLNNAIRVRSEQSWSVWQRRLLRGGSGLQRQIWVQWFYV